MKIALVGTAPSSVHLAPYSNPEWTIWACSPGCVPVVKRADAWFELHDLNDAEVCTPDYIGWLANFPKPVYVIEPDPRIPTSKKYPRDEMVARFGPYFWTSTLSWMFAMAIMEAPKEIGLWGVDMSATEEWGGQRSGCHFFVTQATRLGITVTTPPQSDLLRPPAQYGFCTTSPMFRKLKARRAELDSRIAAAATEYENQRNLWHFLKGARDDLEYVEKTWMNNE